jgi:8-oxo-dGTP diphosphatase
VTIYLVRHVKAGERHTWRGDDRLRPVSKAGQLQARAIAHELADAPFERIFSSPYVRCIESMAPLACIRCLAIEPSDALAEGAHVRDALGLVQKHAHGGVVVCSHGDVIPALLEHFASLGVDLGPRPECAKGSTWVLETNGASEVVGARYVPPGND